MRKNFIYFLECKNSLFWGEISTNLIFWRVKEQTRFLSHQIYRPDCYEDRCFFPVQHQVYRPEDKKNHSKEFKGIDTLEDAVERTKPSYS